MNRPFSYQRRELLAGLAAGVLLPQAHALAASAGDVPGARAPRLQLRDHHARPLWLDDALRGHVTAVQLIFTGCSATCPVQGAQFAALARSLPAWARLLSLSIDALGDDPARLNAWLARFGAPAAWLAAVPSVMQVSSLVSFLSGTRRDGTSHDDRVFLFDRQARLAWRSEPAPSNREVASAITHALAL